MENSQKTTITLKHSQLFWDWVMQEEAFRDQCQHKSAYWSITDNVAFYHDR